MRCLVLPTALALAVSSMGATAAEPSPASWSLSTDLTLEAYHHLDEPLIDGDRLLVLGTRCDPFGGGPCGVDLLETRDSLNWEIVGILIPTATDVTGMVGTDTALTVIGATGARAGQATAEHPRRAAIWRSVDGGQSWRPRAGGPADEPGVFALGADGQAVAEPPDAVVEASIDAITDGPVGLLAVGHFACADCVSLGPPGEHLRPAMWRSADGDTWERVPWADGLPDAATVIDDGPGYLVGGAEGIWSSADGITWFSVGDFAGDRILHLVHGPEGLVALGSDRDDLLVAWVRGTDGSWDRHSLAATFPDAYTTTQVRHLRRVGDALAQTGLGGEIWWSTDAVDWVREPIPGPIMVAWDIADLAGSTVLVGFQGWGSSAVRPNR
jgi:hypothetical protein